jgi:hypothetical protein
MPLLPLPVVDGMDVGKSNIPAAIMATITIPRVEIPVTVAKVMVVVRLTHALIRVTQLAATIIVPVVSVVILLVTIVVVFPYPVLLKSWRQCWWCG